MITNRGFAGLRAEIGYRGKWIVFFTLRPEAARIFGDLTAAHINRGLALVVDGKVASARTHGP